MKARARIELSEDRIINQENWMKAGCAMRWIYSLILLGFTSVAVQASETDDRIESTFENSFVYKTYLADEEIEIKSTNGAVTLTGKVYGEIQRQLAQDAAEALPGVTSVANRITLSPQSASEKSDGRLALQVKNVLMFHRHVNPAATRVYVQDGYVTIRGEVASEDQKDLATQYAMDVEGVKGVKNEMAIAKSAANQGGYYSRPIDDTSISAQVRGLLALQRSTRHIDPAVRTSDGVVTLNGTAKNAEEKAWVTRLAEDVPGVKSVNNNMALGERQHAMASGSADGDSMVGAAGPQGPTGPAGEQGMPGATGAAGAKVTGAAGEAGGMGATGERGATGATGARGDVVRGAAGATGPAGAEGAEGRTGATGETGRSEIGATGATGATGSEGARGATGVAGAKGETLVGPTGPAGRAGEAGARGTAGETGERGATTVGARGAAGETGVSGARGETGAIGSRGPTGAIERWTSYRAFWFGTSTAELRGSDMSQVTEIADYLKKNPTLKLGIDAAVPGNSEARIREQAGRQASAVRAALIRAGVPADRIETGSFGDPQQARVGRVEVLIRTGA
jgi:hyperosmotically inducible periplasmic protein